MHEEGLEHESLRKPQGQVHLDGHHRKMLKGKDKACEGFAEAKALPLIVFSVNAGKQ